MARLNYLELPVGDVGALKRFYGQVFDWQFTDFGPSYAATMTGDTDVGIDGDAQGRTQLLPVIAVDDLEATLAAVGLDRPDGAVGEAGAGHSPTLGQRAGEVLVEVMSIGVVHGSVHR